MSLRHSLIIIYKAFLWLHLDYTDIIDDTPNNMNICYKVWIIQYNAVLAIARLLKGCQKKGYQEPDFEYLRSRRWLRKLFLLHKIVVKKVTKLSLNYILKVNQFDQTITNF